MSIGRTTPPPYDRLLALGRDGRIWSIWLRAGKLARRSAPHFATCEAIDPSAGCWRSVGGSTAGEPNIR